MTNNSQMMTKIGQTMTNDSQMMTTIGQTMANYSQVMTKIGQTMTDNTQMMTKLNWHLSIGIHVRKEGSSCQKRGHQGNAGEGLKQMSMLGVLMLEMGITVMMLLVVVMITL